MFCTVNFQLFVSKMTFLTVKSAKFHNLFSTSFYYLKFNKHVFFRAILMSSYQKINNELFLERTATFFLLKNLHFVMCTINGELLISVNYEIVNSSEHLIPCPHFNLDT